VADAVMDRPAVPVLGEDVLAPFLPPAAAQPPRHPGLRRRPEPRNMTFADVPGRVRDLGVRDGTVMIRG
jgi:hypothetical protein